MKQPKEFQIPNIPFPDAAQIEQKLLRVEESDMEPRLKEENARPGEVEPRYAVPGNVVRGMADVATSVWKARTKMLDGASGEVREEMKRVYRHIESVFESFERMGIEVKDHTGDHFDYGLPLKVITTEPKEGINHETVLETIKPTVYWERKIIQMGEVVIATPLSPEPKHE